MEEYYYKRNHVPAFGSWDWNDNFPFTQCFESARQAGLVRHSYSQSEDRDLYVTGDLYEKKDVSSTMIVDPRRRAMDRDHHERETKKKNWVSDMDSEPPKLTPKPVDEDLYMISPEFHLAKVKKKRSVLCLFSSCLLPTCIA
ncbi:uncharacterized protein LOC130732466 isoform X2 [Lotus japonicus]|uniref:uncharacterized protein LOC130732466 isoform X2 n=1 Tax=Lotus japonicus TaxID=34305 RepID=UPI00258B09AE|nr:uncharacterized protein LOC130732466 isoform X2 [Lotus japonicus]